MVESSVVTGRVGAMLWDWKSLLALAVVIAISIFFPVAIPVAAILVFLWMARWLSRTGLPKEPYHWNRRRRRP